MTYLYMTLGGVAGCAIVLVAYWLGVKNTEATFRLHGHKPQRKRSIFWKS
jgi:hypothetical protein